MAKEASQHVPRVLVRSAYFYDTDAVSDASALRCLDPSKTIQGTAAETDINQILKSFAVTGMLPQVARPPTYEDFEDAVSDFTTAQNLIVEANRSFMGLNADVRARFGNDPGAFVEFCSVEANREEMEKMGLSLPRKPVETTSQVGAPPVVVAEKPV
ncbi:MAG: internal scaffolding protein [Microvirus sp.]|nr:MAG: internal scaffolding protein [Microvirus sp.]